MNDNMRLYEAFRKVPEEAKKPIKGGRLAGFTDINPMWRIKVLTEVFGPCGIGWWPVIKEKRIEATIEGDEVRAFVDIDLYYKYNGETSMPVPGTGGASFVTKEKTGVYVSDECFKMAYTDAISNAAKLLGVGADVFYEKDRSKYTAGEQEPPATKAPPKCEKCGNVIEPFVTDKGVEFSPERIAAGTKKKYGRALCIACSNAEK